MNKVHYGVQLLAYYLAWFSGITLAARGFAWISVLVVFIGIYVQMYWQYKVQHNLQGLGWLLALLVLLGTLVDSLLVFNGIVVFAANPLAPYVAPPWMMAVWISFTVVLYATARSFFQHLVILGLLSFLGFTLAYAIGAKMGAAYFPHGYQTCFFIGSLWLILLPLILCFYEKIMDIK